MMVSMLPWGNLSVKQSPRNGLACAKYIFFLKQKKFFFLVDGVMLSSKEVVAVDTPVYFAHPCKHWIITNFKNICQEFSGSPVVRTLRFHCQRPGFDPWSGNWDSTSHSVHFPANQKKKICWDFHDGPLVKNPPSNAGDRGSIPGQDLGN